MLGGCFVAACKCEHAFQDERYGRGRRVFNRTRSKDSSVRYGRCSVCSNEVVETGGGK